jgi:acyl carrier protein
MKTIQERVDTIIRSIKREIRFPIKPEMSLKDDLFFDSLDLLMLVNAIEAEFRYEVDLGEAEKIKTVGDIIRTLEMIKKQAS